MFRLTKSQCPCFILKDLLIFNFSLYLLECYFSRFTKFSQILIFCKDFRLILNKEFPFPMVQTCLLVSDSNLFKIFKNFLKISKFFIFFKIFYIFDE